LLIPGVITSVRPAVDVCTEDETDLVMLRTGPEEKRGPRWSRLDGE
jgi:hypothetical protein